MSIVLDADNLFQKSYTGYLEHTLFTGLATSLPRENFLIPDQAIHSGLPKNMTPVEFPSQKGILTRLKTQKWLEAHKVSAFISFKRTLKKADNIKQILIIASSKNWEDQYLQKADKLCFTTVTLQNRFLQQFPLLKEKCLLLSPIVQKTDQESYGNSSIKAEFTDDREYFISADFDLTKEKLVTLLKGFSIFKKMQQSNWKLMVALRSDKSISQEKALQLLATYKYRDDVVLTDDEQLMRKIAASYLAVSLSETENYPVPVAEAVLNHIPAIAKTTSALKNCVADGCCIEMKEAGSQEIGDTLMRLYKDEKLRQTTVKKIVEWASSIEPDKAVDELKGILTT